MEACAAGRACRGCGRNGRTETTVDALVRCIRKGAAAECQAAASVLGMVFLTGIVDDEARFQDVLPVLQEACRHQTQPAAQAAVRRPANAVHGAHRAPYRARLGARGRPQVGLAGRTKCVATLAMCCLLASTEPTSAVATLNFMEELFSRSYAPDVAAAAIDGWGLLVTASAASAVAEANPRSVPVGRIQPLQEEGRPRGIGPRVAHPRD